MRRLAPLVALLFATAALAQEPKEPKGPDDVPGEDPADAKLDRVALVLDPGWHTAPVRSLAFTPGGHLVSYARDHFVRITDPASGAQTVLTVPGLPDAEKNLSPSNTDRAAVSADGTRVAVPARYPNGDGFERVVYVLSLPDGKVVRAIDGFKPNETVQAVSVSRDGKKVAVVGSDAKSEVAVWAEGEEKPKRLPRTGVRHLAFSPAEVHKDRLLVLSVPKKGGELTVYDVTTGAAVAGPVPDERPHYSPAWSRDGTRLATARSGMTAIHIWTGDLKPVRAFEGIGEAVTGQAFSPTADRLLAALHPGTHAHHAAVFDLATGERKVDFSPQKQVNRVTLMSVAAAWSPTGDAVATGGGRGGDGFVAVWDATAGKVTRGLFARTWQTDGSGLTRAAWSPDGKAVAWKNRPPVTAFNLADLAFLKSVPKEQLVEGIQTAGGTTLKTDNHIATARVVKDGREGATLQVGYGIVPGKWSFLQPDKADRVAVATGGGTRVCDTATGKALVTFDGTRGTMGVAASPDGRFVLVASANQTVRVFRPDRPAPLLSLYMNGPDWVVWTPEGYYASSPNGERLIGWKVDNGRDAAPSYYPAEQFRPRLYRPDVIKLVLEKGDVAEAVKAADAARPGKAAAAPPAVRTPAEVLPPGVALAVDQSKTPLVTVTATAKSAAAGQNVKSLRLLLDGRRVKDAAGKDAVVEFADGKEPKEVKQVWQVTVPPGRHTLSVLARSTDDTPSFSAPHDVLVPLAAGQRPALHVLSVGVSQYQTVKPPLRFAHSDADRVVDAFTALTATGLAYKPGSIPKALTNANATTKNVLAALDEARKEVKPGDLFVFFFAGHGTRDGGEFFLVTHDADDANAGTLRQTAVKGSDVRAALADFPCQVLMILDACHGGQIAGMPPGGDEAARRLAAADARVAVMCAALGHETAKEANGAGVFTAALARALSDPVKAGAFYNTTTGELNVYHLHAWVYQEVFRPEREQSPYLKMPLGHPAFTVNQLPKDK